MRDYAKIIFELVGTTQQPTADRELIYNLLNFYRELASAKERTIIFRANMMKIFEENPGIIITLKVLWNGSFWKIYPLEAEFFLHTCPRKGALCLLKDSDDIVNIAQCDLDKIIDTFFTPEENELFDSIENYEKNLLSNNISTQNFGSVSKL